MLNREEQALPVPGIIHAPYNFVPFPEQVLIPYPQNVGRPRYSDSMTEYLSGRIHITVTAETPIVISEPMKGLSKEISVPFTKDTDGTPVIPGSTLRGLLRSNMTILGFGNAQNAGGILPLTPYYREIWDPEKDPATIGRQMYRQQLGVETHTIPGTEKRYSIPTKVFGGYFYRDKVDSGFIRPTKEPVYHFTRQDPLVEPWSDRYAVYERIWYQMEDARVTRISTCEFPGGKSGFILSPAWKKNQKSLYLFLEEDSQAPTIPITAERIVEYQMDCDRVRSKRRGTNRDYPSDPAFWDLPQERNKPKPVFYHLDGERINIGMNRFLRLSCGRTLVEYLPVAHQRKTLSDYPSAIFGTIDGKRGLASRVSVGDCRANGVPSSFATNLYFKRPDATFGITYLQAGKTFHDEDAILRGYKQYWLKDPDPSLRCDSGGFETMPKGTVFSGVIRYHHLTPDELGLLLWCIQQEEGCFHSIGRGKPYGYGRTRIQIDALYEYDAKQMYHSLSSVPVACATLGERVADLIQCYKNKACALLGCPEKSLLDYPHIQDFLYMKRTIRTDADQVRYMLIKKGFNEFEQSTGPLPTVQQIRTQETAGL